jgi:ATP-binding protein involved in chromosome partitioning
MIDPRSEPESIGPTEDGARLAIVWRDGHRSEYPPLLLRLACRCAACIDERTGRPILDPARVPAAVHPLAIHYVGRYALRFDWSDGHGTGIHPFEMLRELCPCCTEGAPSLSA